MAIEKINFRESESVQSVYDGQAVTALQLAGITAHKVDECIDLVNGVEQSAIEATDIVDTMRIAQEQFITENNDVRQNLVTDNQEYLDSLTTSKAQFETELNESKSLFETNMTNAVNTIITNAETTIETNVVTKIDELITDGTIENLINIDTEKSIAESTGIGIINGLQVMAQASPNMSVLVSLGVAHLYNGKRYEQLINQTINIDNADITFPRIDIIYIDSIGVLSYLKGDAKAIPTPPEPINSLLLAEIYVNVGTTSINDLLITDKRLIKSTNNNINSQIELINTKLINYNQIINVLNEGIKCDGTDETIAFQNALTKAVINHGVLYIPKGKTVVVDSLTVSNGENFALQIDGYLKRKDNANNQPLLSITGSNNIHILNYNADGNIINNGVTVNEHQHLLVLGTSSHIYIKKIKGINVAGDVLYINGCEIVICDSLNGYSDDTGRNTLSIVKGKILQFDKIISINVGYTTMPGGVDIEPNLVSDDVQQIQFNSIYVEGVGTNLFTLTNNSGSICGDVIVNSLICKKKSVVGASRNSIALNKFNNVKITNAIVKEDLTDILQATSTGMTIWGCRNLDINVDISNVNIGAIIGQTNETVNLNLKGSIKNTKLNGMIVGVVSSSNIEMNIDDCNVSNVGNNPHITFNSASLVNNLSFKNCRLIKTAYGSNAVYFSGTLNNLRFENCELRGWTSTTTMGGVPTSTTGIYRINCVGHNFLNTSPIAGIYWTKGEFVENTEPVILGDTGSKYIIKGWLRLTNGYSQVLNTDWVEMRFPIGI
jgi:hypothetical protein